MAPPFELGVQSYCFREFLPIPRLVEALEQVGVAYVEIWPRHLPWDWPEIKVDTALDILDEHGITVSGYGQVRFAEEAQAHEIFEFAEILGIETLTADPDPEAFEMLEGLTEMYGIRIAIHNHGRDHRYGHLDALEAVFRQRSERFGLCLDTGWFLDAGCDPLEVMARFPDRILGVHLKDFAFDEAGGHEDVIIGTGGVDLPALMRRLQDIGFDGYMSIEYEGEPAHPIGPVLACVEAAEEAMEGL